MPAVYRSCPSMPSHYAHGKAFPTAEDALRHARNASDAFYIAYEVYACLDGRPKRLATFRPSESPRCLTLNPKEIMQCNP